MALNGRNSKLFEEYQASKDSKGKRSEDLRNKIAEKYVSLIGIVAGRIHKNLPRSVQREDLRGYGSFGLIKGVEDYDPHRGVKLQAYLSLRIQKAILDGLREMDIFPRSVRGPINRVSRIREAFSKENGREISPNELLDALEEIFVEDSGKEDYRGSLERLKSRTSRYSCLSVVSIDGSQNNERIENPNNEGSNPFSNDVADYREKESSENVGTAELSHLIFGGLSDRDARIFYLRYFEGLTLRAIGGVLGLSEGRIGRIHERRVKELRKRFGGLVGCLEI